MFLPNNEHTFQVNIKGERTGEQFFGTFVVKCILNTEEQVEVALRTDRYNAGSKSLAPQYALMNRTVAELEMRIKKDKDGKMQAPTWFIESDFGRLLYDSNVLFEVFTQAMKGEEEWSKRIKEKADAQEKKVEAQPPKEASA